MACTHDVSVSDGVLTKRFRSWSRDEHRREWAALIRVSATVPDLVPRPVEAFLDAEPPLVRMTVVPGAPLNGPLSDVELTALESALRLLWSLPASGLYPLSLDVSGLRDVVLARRPPSSGIIADAHAAAVDFLDGVQVELDARVRPVLAHGDPNLSNYLWDGRRVRIVDFEDSGIGDLEDELAKLVEHISSRDTDWEAFVSRFDVDPSRFRIHRVLWATFWLTLLMPGGPSAHRNPPGTATSQATHLLTLLP